MFFTVLSENSERKKSLHNAPFVRHTQMVPFMRRIPHRYRHRHRVLLSVLGTKPFRPLVALSLFPPNSRRSTANVEMLYATCQQVCFQHAMPPRSHTHAHVSFGNYKMAHENYDYYSLVIRLVHNATHLPLAPPTQAYVICNTKISFQFVLSILRIALYNSHRNPQEH